MRERKPLLIKEIIIFLLLTAGFLFIPHRLPRLLLSALMIYRLVGLLSRWYILHHVQIKLDVKDHFASQHNPFDLELVLSNSGVLPIPPFTVECSSSGLTFLKENVQLVSLNGLGSQKLTFTLVGDSRGIYQWGPFKLNGLDPLQLYSWEKKILAEQRIILYPQTFLLNMGVSRGLTGGSLPVHNRIYENMTSFQALRKYQSGDELKRINWKASARMGELYSNIYDCSLFFPVQLVLNLSEQEYPLTHRFELVEKAVETAASLAIHYLEIKQTVSLLNSGRNDENRDKFRWIPPGMDQDHSALILQELSGIKGNPKGMGLKELFQLPQNQGPQGTKYILITPPPLQEDMVFIQQQRRLGKDIELFLVSGYQSHRKGLAPPGIPCYIIQPQQKGAVREF